MKAMTSYVLQRIISLIPVLLAITFITFISIRLIPGGPAEAILGANYSDAAAAEINERLGLDRPFFTQMIDWYAALFTGDLGTSLLSNQPVTTVLSRHFGFTLKLAIVAAIWAIGLALPLGIYAARKRGRPIDFGLRAISVIGISVPSFVVGVVLIYVFAVKLQWLPAASLPPSGSSLWQQLKYMILPALALGSGSLAIQLKMMRASYLEEMNQDYVRTARSKGLSKWSIMFKHTLRNSLLAVVTLVAMDLSFLLGGAVVIERVFSWPGLGSLVVDSILRRDYPVVQGVVMLLATIFVLANLVADLLLLILDPRLRRG